MVTSALSSVRVAALGLALCAAACGGGESSPAGSYTLDHDSFVDQALQVMTEQGQIPSGAEELARAMLRQIVFKMDLAEDGSFTANMSVPSDRGFQRATYTGMWSQRGDLILITQTHENGKEKPDTMNGTIEADGLHLDHMEDGLNMRYVLRRIDGTPASPR